MTQFIASQTCSGFVNPAELCTPFHNEFEDLRIASGGPLIPMYNSWKAEQLEVFRASPWTNQSPLPSPTIQLGMEDYTSSSSDSPSPIGLQPGQNHKRRAQNRAAYVSACSSVCYARLISFAASEPIVTAKCGTSKIWRAASRRSNERSGGCRVKTPNSSASSATCELQTTTSEMVSQSTRARRWLIATRNPAARTSNE